MVKQLLIKWDLLPEAMATWEDEGEIRMMFPQASLV